MADTDSGADRFEALLKDTLDRVIDNQEKMEVRVRAMEISLGAMKVRDRIVCGAMIFLLTGAFNLGIWFIKKWKS